MTKNSIISDFEKYVGTDNYSDWYVGITNDIDRRLFNEHKVDKKQDKWIQQGCCSGSGGVFLEKGYGW